MFEDSENFKENSKTHKKTNGQTKDTNRQTTNSWLEKKGKKERNLPLIQGDKINEEKYLIRNFFYVLDSKLAFV